jgi:outer membrane protein assembly factor BamB
MLTTHTKRSARVALATFLLPILLATSLNASGGILLGSNAADNMYSIDAATGVATLIGPSGFNSGGKGLAYDPQDDVIYAIGTNLTDLYTVDRVSGAWTLVGGGFDTPTWAALTFNANNNTLYGADQTPQELFSINPLTGVRTTIGAISQIVSGLAHDAANDILFGVGNDDVLYNIDMSNGNLTTIGALGVGVSNVGLAFDYDNNELYMNSAAMLYKLNVNTGAATLIGANGIGGTMLGLTYIGVPEPHSMLLLSLGILITGAVRRRRTVA